ncbi:Gpi16 domain containing protein [Asbolus verrucosus]|uniref:Gpi16 domain containing protein n=1 Tax=Asbolus verrucosus TaxID=1661398 RepID=A0A482WE52_ASBVE|nr:Gpi16 domain containing protein [Asbolus verrucosus]
MPWFILTSKSDRFSEELLIKPLYSDHLYVHFQFATKWDTNPDQESFRHTHIFPRALGEIIERYNVQELHVSLAGGLWRYETWGYPILDAAPGAEVWAWFKADTEDVDKNWKELASSLSGLLCASLNFINVDNSVNPEYTFKPRGVVSDQKINSTYVRYASLPREIVCTENLTPWKKLLPCESKSGLASLLNSGYIHNVRYHSIAIHMRPVCRDDACEFTSLELQQSVSLVYDYLIMGTKNWSFRKLFGQGLMGPCPLSENSVIFVDTTSNVSVPFQLIPSPDDYITSVRGGHVSTFAKYNVKPYAMSINANYLGKESVLLNSPPSLHANQYITGYGQERGGIVTKIYNNHWGALEVVVLQNIPWYVPIYLHTLKIDVNGVRVEPVGIHYIPGRQRQRPYHLEILLKLPPRSVASVSIDFDYVFLKWQEYPPDANHGFYIGSAVISANLPLARNFTGLPQDGATIADSFNASRRGYLVQVRTENMVITLPTPDFSMPYNVICLACTVVALAFGPLHNITTKRLVLTVKDNEKLIVKIKNRIVKAWTERNSGSDVNQSVQ